MKNCLSSGLATRLLLLRLERRRVIRRAVGLAHPAAADLVLRDLADRILRGDSQLIRALLARPVVRNEHGVGPDRRHDLRLQRHRPAPRLGRRPVAVGDAERRPPAADAVRAAAPDTA